jgi:hypothetical protein
LEAALIASYAPVSREAKTGKRRAIRPAQLSMIGSTKFSVPARALKARWGELEEQYRYASDNLGITFDRPDLEAWRDPEPNWDDATLASIAAALSELTGTQDKLRRARRRLANGRRKAASRRREAQFA